MEVSQRRSEIPGGGIGISQSATDEQARQRVKRIAASCGIGCSIRSDRGKTRQIAKNCGKGLHLRWVFSGQFPAHG
jgi:hypothetical protein